MVVRFKPKHRVAVLAYDGVVLGDLSTPCEILGRARTRSGEAAYEVRVCSARPGVRAGPVSLATSHRLNTLAWAQTIVVPGLERPAEGIGEPELRALRRAIDRGARVASICTGAFVLAQTGALDGRRVTTHWRVAGLLAAMFPSLEVDPDVLYVDHGRLLTSAGAAAGLDLCLHLVRRDFGALAAATAAREAVMPLERSGGQAQFIVHPPPSEAASAIAPLLRWLERNLELPLTLETIARRAALSTRSLSRRFRAEVGITPAAWVASARVRRAQVLLEAGRDPVERIAEQVGFGSATVLRQHFARLVGTAPTSYRKAFSARRA